MVTDTLGSSRSDPVVSSNMKFKLNSFVALLIVAILVGILNGLLLEVSYEVSQLTNPNSLLFIASDLHNH
ncbi:hypothetical protein [Neobacillus sp. OS1-33]|uniref:GntT/GntP/DsdX family permease n=1 Tax=Neobacillus sp. OS1-33 TaxID=3070683 RepID=UPI0027DFCD3B|nr:hypothetical protein [Neobacillus sp. OS1-33]WML23852.1 hypothetical protein RCG22_12710 [Neobacillus sp. OS1-33]